MARSSTLCARFVNSLLAARDRRQAVLDRALKENGQNAVVFLSLNIPGIDKTPTGAAALFAWALGEFAMLCSADAAPLAGQDSLGYFALAVSRLDPPALKRAAMALETAQPAARLLDLDVYRSSGAAVGRRELGLPPRACPLCDQPAVDCMRLQRHAREDVINKVYELLKNFSA